ncbi:hypothetical protein [Frigoribacterium sp. CG_9.8]|uniref:hypothetical protein n=1 Tax=Frigoribacterium sp. CG_9.8 TaxID=2787733 RepID=UPI0018C94322|nr:hypothetical protein [Frigoribacterium sp. CG_9.8]MBG6106573.1 hypothetical protein [Frigoribacterium sp. CG_9.8]
MLLRNPPRQPLTAKQLRKREAARIAQERGATPDARTYFNQVQLLKGEHLRRYEAERLAR